MFLRKYIKIFLIFLVTIYILGRKMQIYTEDVETVYGFDV